MAWSFEQVLALAPDPSSAKSGKDLSAPRKWKTLGTDAHSAWGTIQGSGKDPYQTSIDLSGPAFKCSCPSRKFPCKHALGLFLILAQQPGTMTEKTPPAWTTEWLAKRAEQEEKKTAKAAAPSAPPDPEAVAKAAAAAEKRAASRESKINDGLCDLGVWIEDLVRTGFASLPGRPSSFWETPAARLVDAQAPGLARRVAALDGITATGEGWPARLLRETALLHLAREGWSRLAALPESTRADLRSVIGFTVSQQELLAQPGIRDRWCVVGQRIEEEERLRTQRTWLFGENTKRAALVLSFSAGPNQPLDVTLVPGTTIEAELVFYPSAAPLRAVVKERHGAPITSTPALPHTTVAQANQFAAGMLAANLWIERVPLGLRAVIPLRVPNGWWVVDADGHGLPLSLFEAQAWVLYAVAGGEAVGLAGEWDGEQLRPLSLWAEGRFLRL
jgi:hypothetical protein